MLINDGIFFKNGLEPFNQKKKMGTIHNYAKRGILSVF